MNLSPHQKELINRQLDLVLELNQIHNLTNITDKSKAQDLHINDSLSAVELINGFNNPKKFVDLGSGCGYPGICLSLATGISVDLIESVEKKANCLKSIVSKLKEETRISVINSRIEEYSKDNKNMYDFATARALSSLPSLLELSSPLLKIGGYLIAYKGEFIESELNNAIKICDKLGFVFETNYKYNLSNSIHRLITFKKTHHSKIKLPRRNGLAQKRPVQ